MSAGTLTLTNNSASVGGSGTAFATELTAGDFIVATVGGITYTLPVKSLESATSLTLVSKYLGPTQSGVAWSAVPRAAQNQITAALVAQTTEALRGLNSDKQNWQAVFSDSGDITVILPDGSSFTGPGWKKISDLLADIDPAGLQQIADQVAAYAQQVATDRQNVDTKAAQVSGNAATASQAATDAVAANTTAQQAKTDAIAAKVAAEAARDAAQSANPDNQLKKSNNLSDLTDIATAQNNLSVYSKSQTDNAITAALADTPWLPMTLSSGFTLHTTYDPSARAVYRVNKGYLEVQVSLKGPTANAGVFFTLPTGSRPSIQYFVRAVGPGSDYNTSPSYGSYMVVRTDGTLSINSTNLDQGFYAYFKVPMA